MRSEALIKRIIAVLKKEDDLDKFTIEYLETKFQEHLNELLEEDRSISDGLIHALEHYLNK